LGETNSETETEEDTLLPNREQTALVRKSPTNMPPSASPVSLWIACNTTAQSRVTVETDPEDEESLGDEDTETELEAEDEEDTPMVDIPATSLAFAAKVKAPTSSRVTQYEIPEPDDESLGNEGLGFGESR